jgi:hypothetical protein
MNGTELTLRASEFFKAMGFDISLAASYPLLSFMDLGGSIEHIPIVPARLAFNKHMAIDQQFTVDIDSFIDGDVGIDKLIPELDSSPLTDAFMTFRPLRLDVYALFRPLENGMLILRPNAGLSFLTIYGYKTVCFNAGVEGTVFLWRFFSGGLRIEYREKIWRQMLNLGFNCPYGKIDLGIYLESPDFVSGFTGKGLGVQVGLRGGY